VNHPLPRDARRVASRRATAVVAGLLALLVAPAAALGDAQLVNATPGDGDVITTVPPEAVLTFDEALDGRSSFTILDSSGATVASGALDPVDVTMIRGDLPALAAGAYEVQWVAGSQDSHLVRGTYSFTVTEPTPPPPTATPEPSADVTDAPTIPPTAPPSPSPSSDGGPAGNATDVVLPIVVVGLLVAGGLLWFLRRRGPA
jgi:methionine-rich copper-binding protein CopC